MPRRHKSTSRSPPIGCWVSVALIRVNVAQVDIEQVEVIVSINTFCWIYVNGQSACARIL